MATDKTQIGYFLNSTVVKMHLNNLIAGSALRIQLSVPLDKPHGGTVMKFIHHRSLEGPQSCQLQSTCLFHFKTLITLSD